MHKEPSTLASRLRQAMSAANVSGRPEAQSAWLSEKFNLSSGLADSYIRGDVTPPELVLVQIADALRVSPSWLSTGIGSMAARTKSPPQAIPRTPEPVVVAVVPARKAKSLGLTAMSEELVPMRAYEELEAFAQTVSSRFLRLEGEALREAVDVGPRDLGRWRKRLEEIAAEAVAADQAGRLDELEGLLLEGIAIQRRWLDGLK
jgi:hypothetical protein